MRAVVWHEADSGAEGVQDWVEKARLQYPAAIARALMADFFGECPPLEPGRFVDVPGGNPQLDAPSIERAAKSFIVVCYKDNWGS